MEKEISSVKSEKRHTEKLRCVRIIHFTELQLSPQEAFC